MSLMGLVYRKSFIFDILNNIRHFLCAAVFNRLIFEKTIGKVFAQYLRGVILFCKGYILGS